MTSDQHIPDPSPNGHRDPAPDVDKAIGAGWPTGTSFRRRHGIRLDLPSPTSPADAAAGAAPSTPNGPDQSRRDAQRQARAMLPAWRSAVLDLAAIAPIAVLGLGDIPMMKSTLDHVIRASTTVSVLVTIGVAGGLIVAAHSAGRLTRTPRRLALAVLLLGGAVAVALALTAMRWHAAQYTTTDAFAAAPGTINNAVDTVQVQRDHALSLLFAGLEALSIALGYLLGSRHDEEPGRLEAMMLRRHATALARAEAANAQILTVLAGAPAHHQAALEQIDADRRAAITAMTARVEHAVNRAVAAQPPSRRRSRRTRARAV